MTSGDESPLIPDYGDLEEAREAEIEALTPPPAPSTWRGWVPVGLLIGFAAAAFVGAWVLSAGIPVDGDAAREAQITALVTAGGTAGAAAVAIAAVVLTLGLQREQEQQRRWADFQVETLSEAYAWIDGVLGAFGGVLSAMEEWHHAVNLHRDEKLGVATERAQQFYDSEERLSEVERLERLIADREVRAAMRRADGALRLWNESVAGDHTSREVRLHDAAGSSWEAFTSLVEARDEVVRAYAAAIRDAVRGASS